jgi:hypothetical protein
MAEQRGHERVVCCGQRTRGDKARGADKPYAPCVRCPERTCCWTGPNDAEGAPTSERVGAMADLTASGDGA